ncbi:S41 family peptidase [Aquimarina sp. AU474]|uniref:S41 family peptidase n=1 Tax=Aquimarina sp. AU474 TaxID=2108529 RepID=UPI000D695095|nr:S41 family peptidase [Aquimarina sp. AU474]
MRKIIIFIKFTIIIVTFLIQSINYGQSSYTTTINQVKELLEKNYIFLDKAKETNAHLDKLVQNGAFDNTTPNDFATLLTKELRKITKDKHLRFSYTKSRQVSKKSKIEFTENFGRYRTPMLRGFQLMDDNIGYIDLAFFGGSPQHRAKIDLVMKEMGVADAIIIDMRRNGGGSPDTVNYLSSYFFDEKLLLNTIYARVHDHTEEMWVADVNGNKRPEVPVYILTSEKTFSGAEDFSYTMQSRERAIIIGEVTGGGAHPTRYHQIENSDFGISIPFARTVNTITKTNWEGTGVQPDIKMSADLALDKAKELSKTSGKNYSNALYKPLEKAINEITDKNISNNNHTDVLANLKTLLKVNMLDEGEINNLGYSYLQNAKNHVAIVLFKANTLLFPESANVYDSYAEALARNNNKELALANYKKAVATATKHKDAQLEIFENNLKKFETQN